MSYTPTIFSTATFCYIHSLPGKHINDKNEGTKPPRVSEKKNYTMAAATTASGVKKGGENPLIKLNII